MLKVELEVENQQLKERIAILKEEIAKLESPDWILIEKYELERMQGNEVKCDKMYDDFVKIESKLRKVEFENAQAVKAYLDTICKLADKIK